MFQIQPDCPAVAAHITCNADLGIAEVACHPLWLERNQSQTPMQRDVKKLLDITGTLWYVVCLPGEEGKGL